MNDDRIIAEPKALNIPLNSLLVSLSGYSAAAWNGRRLGLAQQIPHASTLLCLLLARMHRRCILHSRTVPIDPGRANQHTERIGIPATDPLEDARPYQDR